MKTIRELVLLQEKGSLPENKVYSFFAYVQLFIFNTDFILWNEKEPMINDFFHHKSFWETYNK